MYTCVSSIRRRQKEEELEREVEEKQVLSSDGSDFGLLHDLLKSVSRRNGS